MPRSTRCHCPSRSTRYAAKAHGTPLARSGSAESIRWKCRCGAVELPVWPTRPSTSPARTCWPLVTATLPGARCAYSAYLPAVSTITWLPASPAGSSPRRANLTVVFTATQDSRTGWSHWRSATPSTAWTTTPSRTAWTGCPQPWQSRVRPPISSQRRVPAGCTWNPRRWSVGTRSAGVRSTDHSPRRGSSTTTGSSSSPTLVDQAVDGLVVLEGLEQGRGPLAVPLDNGAGASDGGRAGDRDGGGDAAAVADVAHGEGEPDQVVDVGRLVDGDRLGAPEEQGDAAEGVEKHRRAGRLADQGAEELLLALDPVKVAASAVAGPDIRQGRLAARDLAAGLDVEAGHRVAHGRLGADLDPADGVDHAGEAVEADLHVPVETDAADLLDGAGEQLGAAEGVGRVELVAAMPGDRHIGVAGQADQDRLAGAAGDVQQHHGVGPPPGGLAGAELAAAGLVEALAAVGADDQPVGPGGGGRPAGVVGQGVDPVEPRVDPDPQPDQQHDQDQQGDPDAAPPAPGPAGLGSPAAATAGAPGWALALLAGRDVGDVQVARRSLAHAPGPHAPARGQRLLGPLARRAGPATPVARTLVGPATHRSNLLVVQNSDHVSGAACRAPPFLQR